MTKRIFRSVFLVAGAAFLAGLALVLGVIYEYFAGVQQIQLRAEAALAAQGVESGGAEYLSRLEGEDCRLTWVAADGTVLFDSQADSEAMENHLDRQEIQQALQTGLGESERSSSTLGERTVYVARRLSDGTVLRVSASRYTVGLLLLGMVQPILSVTAAVLLLSALLARRTARRIVTPLNQLDLDRPLENEPYEELAPLLTRIERQHRQIQDQVAALRRRQDEFDAVTGSMSEGLLLLGEKGTVLSINPAAQALFGVSGDCLGADFLTVDRSQPVRRAVGEALAGRHGECVFSRGGGEYQVDASPISSGGKAAGAAVLVFDITEKAQAEQRRREVTANVSHELKTPLQTLLGSAELIESGLARPEDAARFAGNIRNEAARLVSLIDDILRLSQLDEGQELPREETDLYALAEETRRALLPAARKRGVTLDLQGRPAVIRGVPRLLQEIVYNLCDNAVRYNREGGRVTVTVAPEPGGGALLRVEDTGIGIPPEHQTRVFERFYRVDKSHSRQTGGTGLGLSIVKHAAQLHGAVPELQSRPGEGTAVIIHFPGGGEG